MAENKLKVRDLRISFRTASGKLQAVRDISFDLYKGETLAIVGESGSGKSVTSRAIMGILAGNAIVEGGKILYGDKDLLKISEEEFHKIRGDKIAMVFQDPLSSLNPIMRVGNQLTEAMLLKNKASRHAGKESMNKMFDSLSRFMAAVPGDAEYGKTAIAKFKKFELKHCELEREYTHAYSEAKDSAAIAENLILTIKNSAFKDLTVDINAMLSAAQNSCSYFVVRDRADELKGIISEIKTLSSAGRKSKDYSALVPKMETMVGILNEATAFDVPNTFTLGYYLTFVDSNIPDMPVEELNKLTHKKTTEDFMLEFMKKSEGAVRLSASETDKHRAEAADLFASKIPVFEGELDRKQVDEAVSQMKSAALKCLDPLEVAKDSLTHTFGTSIDSAVSLYFDSIVKNEKEKVRYSKQKAKRDKLVSAGKNPTWEVVPESLVNLDSARAEIVDIVKEMIDHFHQQIEDNKTADYAAKTLEIVDYLKACAAESVYKISKAMAKEKAVKLMESVGIDEPRKRFNQYPFEFSGGMRQRIVIAIALTANPDVLICDEPTTALDVTIQAQILELINNLKKERDLSVIFITHDLGVVANMADRIAVMYAGKIVEYGTAEDIFYSPAHPYTWALLSSVPDLDTKEKLESIPGTPPNMIYPPKGDAFADRNKYALEIDFEQQPPMTQITESHYAATWLLHPSAPKIELPKIVQERIEKMRKEREV